MTEPQEIAEIRARAFVPFGYAPGGYMNKCPICEETFTGDKRAFRCKDCATTFAIEQARAFGKAEAHLVVLLAALDAAHFKINAICADAYAATNPANWQKGDTSLKARAACWEKTLDEIADQTAHNELVCRIFAKRTQLKAALDAAKARADVAQERWQRLVNSVASAWNNGVVPGDDAYAFEWARRAILNHADQPAARSDELILLGQRAEQLMEANRRIEKLERDLEHALTKPECG